MECTDQLDALNENFDYDCLRWSRDDESDHAQRSQSAKSKRSLGTVDLIDGDELDGRHFLRVFSYVWLLTLRQFSSEHRILRSS